jgi:hypothetical protein
MILDSFPLAIRHLRDRRAGRPEFEIDHEFDLQDMLLVVLKSIFPDAYLEEYTLKHAGTQKRIDIVIPSINSILETKIVRNQQHSKIVSDEIKVDIESYHVHPNCGTLWVFMFDPKGFLIDPTAVERDLSGIRRIGDKEFTVRVRVRGP